MLILREENENKEVDNNETLVRLQRRANRNYYRDFIDHPIGRLLQGDLHLLLEYEICKCLYSI